jgi:hypothetical protein
VVTLWWWVWIPAAGIIGFILGLVSPNPKLNGLAAGVFVFAGVWSFVVKEGYSGSIADVVGGALVLLPVAAFFGYLCSLGGTSVKCRD